MNPSSEPSGPAAARLNVEAVDHVLTTTRSRHAMRVGPGPSGSTPALEAMPDRVQRIPERRIAERRPNTLDVIEAMGELAENSTSTIER